MAKCPAEILAVEEGSIKTGTTGASPTSSRHPGWTCGSRPCPPSCLLRHCTHCRLGKSQPVRTVNLCAVWFAELTKDASCMSGWSCDPGVREAVCWGQTTHAGHAGGAWPCSERLLCICIGWGRAFQLSGGRFTPASNV